MAEAFDVAIIGGGPAGCMTAAGVLHVDPSLSVVIVEPHASGRHRIGEALLTGTIMALDDAGLAEDIAAEGYHRKIGATYVWGETREPWYVDYPLENEGIDYPECFKRNGVRESIHVPRHVYDAHLQRLMAARGVEFIRKQATGAKLAESPAGPRVAHVTLSDGTRLYAKRYVDCTGQGSFLGKRVTQRLPVGSPRVARYAYTSSLDWELAHRSGFDIHRTNIVSGPNGWFWAIHLGEAAGGLTSFGFVSTPDVLSKLTFANCAEAFPDAALFGFGLEQGYPEPKTFDGKPAERFYGHPDYSHSCVDLDGPNWALAGDAAMFIDPILSQGVTLATHYGFLRGKAAAAEVNGLEGAQAKVTEHYRREAAIMHDVVSMWYSNNRSVKDWRLLTAAKCLDHHGVEFDPVKAFQWITNLENIRDEYDPYPASEREKIATRLGAFRPPPRA